MENLYRWEYTDTFGGEANYAWVRRGLINCEHKHFPTPDLWPKKKRAIVRAAKREAGLSGVRCKVADYGDQVALWPNGMCTVLFVDLGEFFARDGDPTPVNIYK